MTLRLGTAVTGTFDTVAAGADVAGAAVFMGNIAPKVKSLSVKLIVEAETDTVTLSGVWQVSANNSTWFDVANGSQNAAAVALATGTAGGDAVITKVLQAPDACYGWPWVRIALRVGGTTGAAVDTYSYAYAYRQLTAGDRG